MSQTGRKEVFAGGPWARYMLLMATVGLTLLGLVMIYSASSISATFKQGSSWHFLLRQLVSTGLGVIVAFGLSKFDYRRLQGKAPVVWLVSIGLLVVTLLIGVVRGGARRWIPLGIINLQPSEIAKIACVLLVAAIAVEWQRGRIPVSQFARRAAVAALVPSVLIIMQPDFGTTVTLVIAVGFVLLLAGIDWRYVTLAGTGAVVLSALIVFTSDYRMRRVLSFLDPWADARDKGYQSVQALLAFGTGGVDGVGLGLSRQKFFYLPEAHTDFILAIIGEELGLIGALAVVAGFVFLTWAGFKIAIGAKDPFGRLVAGGLTGMIAFQAFLNMAAVTGIMPVTGKPLPFVSYGGASMLTTMMCVGLILSVSKYGALAPRALRKQKRNEGDGREGSGERGRNSRPHLSRVDGSRATRRRA